MTLELTGPGIEVTDTIDVVGLHREEVARIQLARQSYPLGVDLYLVDSTGHCVGLPRTTSIQLMEKE